MKVRFDCDPKRARELQTAVIAILNQTAGGVIDRDIFSKAVKAAKEVWEYSYSNNSIAKRYAGSLVLLNLPLSRLNNWSGLYDNVTHADIQRVCGQLIKNGNNGPALVVLMPETGK